LSPTSEENHSRKIGLKTLDGWFIPCVDLGRCMSGKLEFRNQMQGAHAHFPGPAREFGCSRTYHGYQAA